TSAVALRRRARAEPERRGCRAQDRGVRSALFHHLLRDRRGRLQTGRCLLGARPAGRRLPAAGGAGGGGHPARCELRRAEAHPAALQRRLLRMRRRRRGAPLQPHADRRRPDRRAVTARPTAHALATPPGPGSLPPGGARMAEQGTAPEKAALRAPAVGLAGVTVSFRLAEGNTFTAVERASLEV